MPRLRIGFLLPRYPRYSTSFMPAVVQALADRGAIVEIIHPVDPMMNLSELRVVRSDGELAAVNHGCEPLFAQRYHPGDGRDRKIYAIGGRLFGVKKVFPRSTEEEKHGEPFTLTPQLHDIAERCGRAFGIDLY